MWINTFCFPWNSNKNHPVVEMRKKWTNTTTCKLWQLCHCLMGKSPSKNGITTNKRTDWHYFLTIYLKYCNTDWLYRRVHETDFFFFWWTLSKNNEFWTCSELDLLNARINTLYFWILKVSHGLPLNLFINKPYYLHSLRNKKNVIFTL